MSSREKLIRQLLALPSTMRFSDVKTIVEAFGYTHHQPRSGGSYHIFRKPGSELISIPVHDKRVKRIYLKDVSRKLGLVEGSSDE